MAIAPTAGVAGDSAGSQVSSQTITVPAGILGGDVVLVWSICIPISATTATITASSTGTTPVAVPGGNKSGSEPLPATVTGQLFSFVAAGTVGSASSDVGKVITLTFSTTGFGSQVLQGYSGVNTSSPVDVIGSAFGGASTASVTCPTLSTGVSGDWAVFCGGGAAEGGNLTIPAGSTSRRADFGASDQAATIADSNGQVGSAGTSIGGGTFTTATATNSILVALTVGLAAAGAGGTPASGSPLRPPNPLVLPTLLGKMWARADWQAQGFADLAVAFSSTSGGVDTYNVTSPFNGTGTHPMRVLKPTAPSGNYPHSFLVMLPVDADQDTTFGDSIGTAQSISAHNNYNLTCIQPGYAAVGGGSVGPWHADNPLDQTIYQETFLLKLLPWIKANLGTTGTEKVYLIGFSRSGIGGQALQFRHPDLFAATASWDAPFMMTDYDGTDPTNGGAIGGSPNLVYGTSSSFKTKYQLSAANLAARQATGQYAVNRLWVGLGPAFPADTPAYDTLLTSSGIPHAYNGAFSGDTHAWHTDWVAAALASIIPSGYAQAPTLLPQQMMSHPVLGKVLGLAAVRLFNGTPSSGGSPVSVPGLTAAMTLTAPAGALSAGANVAGATAALSLAAPGGTISSGATIAGATAQIVLGAPLGTLAAGAAIAGNVAQLTLGAPGGAVTTGAGVAGVPATLTFTAPAGSVSAGASIAGTVAVLSLGAPPGSTGQPGSAKPQMLLVFFP